MITQEESRFLREAKESIKHHKDRIKRLQILGEGLKGEFWDAMKEELEVSIKANENERDAILHSDHVDDPIKEYIKVRAKSFAIRSYRGIISNVENSGEKISRTNQKIADLNAKVADIESGAKPARKHQEVV